MKYLNRLFAFSNNRQETTNSSSISLKPSATLASTLYSVTFITKPQLNSKSIKVNRQQFDDNEEELDVFWTDEDYDDNEFKNDKQCQRDNRLRSQSNKLIIDEFNASNEQFITINTINNSIEFEKSPSIKIKTKTTDSSSIDINTASQSEAEAIDENIINTLEASKNRGIISSLSNYILTATIGKTIANTSGVITSAPNIESKEKPTNFIIDRQQDTTILIEEDDWILVDNNLILSNNSNHSSSFNPAQLDNKSSSPAKSQPIIQKAKGVVNQKQTNINQKQSIVVSENNHHNKRIIKLNKKSIIRQMALDNTDVELIKASWIPARKDPVFSGVLLFKGLFTKFPEYLKFFPQFSDLDIENMRENKRLLRHAVKVIETVTFVVDAIGNDSMTAQLNQALHNLVSSHLKRNIGLNEFRNLGIVLIDFICDINNRRQQQEKQVNEHCQLNKSSTGDSINHSSNDDSETMTSTLDKIRASSSPSSSSEDDSYLVGGGGSSRGINSVSTNDTSTNAGFNRQQQQQQQQDADIEANNDVDGSSTIKIDTNVLVAAWTKLYSSILDLVEHEEAQ